MHPPTIRLAGGTEVDVRRGADGMHAFIARADDHLMADVACGAVWFTRDVRDGGCGTCQVVPFGGGVDEGVNRVACL